MSANTSQIPMYEMPLIYEENKPIVLPQNMYQMNAIYHKTIINHNCNENNEQMNGEINVNKCETISVLLDKKEFKDNVLALNALKDLQSRQHILLSRIQDLDSDIHSNGTQTAVERGEEVEGNVSIFENPIKEQVFVCNQNMTKDFVIFSNIKQIPVSVFAVLNLMKKSGIKLMVNIHKHSSLIVNDCHLNGFNSILSSINFKCNDNNVNSRLEYDLIITLIIKDVNDVQMMVSPLDMTPITSEANILRFITRIGAKLRPELSLLYEGMSDLLSVTSVDDLLDEINQNLILNSLNETKYESELNKRLISNKFLTGSSPTIADILLWSGLIWNSTQPKPSPLEQWMTNLTNFIAFPNDYLSMM